MAHRSIHYEAAFEDYLRRKGWPYVAVDEAKKAAFGDLFLKSFDFVVYSETGPNLLVDVKGRKFPDPARHRGSSRRWENWITRDDVEGLQEWEKVFGDGFRALITFGYWLQGSPRLSPFQEVHLFRKRAYGFVGIWLSEYLDMARPRSERWQTLSAPMADFRRAARYMDDFL